MRTNANHNPLPAISLSMRLFVGILLLVLVSALPCRADDLKPKTILVLLSYHPNFPWSANMIKGIEDAVTEQGAPNLELAVEYMDTKKHPNKSVFPHLRGLFAAKYKNSPPDVVIASDDNALDFMLAFGDELFPGVPVVFCGLNNYEEARIAGRENYTGVIEDSDFKATLELALSLHPGTGQVVGIFDSTPSAAFNLTRMRAIKPLFEDKVEFIEIVNPSTRELSLALAKIPPNSIILAPAFYRDRQGFRYSVEQSVRLIKTMTDIPIYTCWDIFLGSGVVGGKMISGHRQGYEAARMALEVVKGVSVSQIPVMLESPNVFMFDYAALVKAGLGLDRIPRDSVVANRPDAFFSRYKKEALIIASMFLLLVGLLIVMGVNILRRKRAENSLRESEERYTLVVQGSNDGIWLWDLHTDAVFVSKRTQEMLGLDLGEKNLTTDFWRELVHPDDRNRSIDVNNACIRGEIDHFQTELRVRRQDGVYCWMLVRGGGLRNRRGLIYRLAGTLTDITERKLAEEKQTAINENLETQVKARTRELLDKASQLEEANRKLREMDEIKSSLVTTVSHDLRTPLTSILGYAKLGNKDFIRHFLPLAEHDPALSAKGNRISANLEIIEREGDRMSRLIGDLLDLSRIESGQCEWNDRIVQPGPLIQEAAEAARGRFMLRPEIEFTCEISPNLPLIKTTPDRMVQVLVNLLDNAEKHTSIGSVALSASTDSKGWLSIKVRDTGQGVPEKSLDLIFDKFHQVRSGDTILSASRGSGVGLSICRRIVEHYGGRISAESEYGVGSVFSVELPPADQDNADQSEES